MQPFSHILVATDFSPSSRSALEAGVFLAKQFGARVTLVHVVEPQFLAYAGTPFLPMVDFASEAERGARALLRASEEELAKQVELTTTVEHGSAWREILADAESSNADLIVLGTHGHTGLARALIGSTAEKVVRMATIPVLTVHAPAQT